MQKVVVISVIKWRDNKPWALKNQEVWSCLDQMLRRGRKLAVSKTEDTLVL